MKKSILIILLILIDLSLTGQSQTKIRKSELGKPHDFSYKEKWKHFILNDTIEAKILNHQPADGSCGGYSFASMTIVLTKEGDTIRVIDMCNTSTGYKAGRTIRIAPAEKQNSTSMTPFTLTENVKTQRFEPNSLDLLVLKTTWGKLLDD